MIDQILHCAGETSGRAGKANAIHLLEVVHIGSADAHGLDGHTHGPRGHGLRQRRRLLVPQVVDAVQHGGGIAVRRCDVLAGVCRQRQSTAAAEHGSHRKSCKTHLNLEHAEMMHSVRRDTVTSATDANASHTRWVIAPSNDRCSHVPVAASCKRGGQRCWVVCGRCSHAGRPHEARCEQRCRTSSCHRAACGRRKKSCGPRAAVQSDQGRFGNSPRSTADAVAPSPHRCCTLGRTHLGSSTGGRSGDCLLRADQARKPP